MMLAVFGFIFLMIGNLWYAQDTPMGTSVSSVLQVILPFAPVLSILALATKGPKALALKVLVGVSIVLLMALIVMMVPNVLTPQSVQMWHTGGRGSSSYAYTLDAAKVASLFSVKIFFAFVSLLFAMFVLVHKSGM